MRASQALPVSQGCTSSVSGSDSQYCHMQCNIYSSSPCAQACQVKLCWHCVTIQHRPCSLACKHLCSVVLCEAFDAVCAEAWRGHGHMHDWQPRLSFPTAGCTHHPGSVPASQAHSCFATVPSGEPNATVHSGLSRPCVFLKALLASRSVTHVAKRTVALRTVFSADTHTRTFMQLPKLTG